MRKPIVAVISFAILCLAPFGRGQQSQPAHQKAVTPEQQAYRQWEAHYRQLRAQGKQTFDAEIAREKAGDCPNASSTFDFDTCYGKQLDTTEANLNSFEETIHDLLAPPPQAPSEPATLASGLGGTSVTAAQGTAEFESVERIWRQYREVACSAAHHQLEGGSGAPGFEMQCRLKRARDHMRELRMIYGESFI